MKEEDFTLLEKSVISITSFLAIVVLALFLVSCGDSTIKLEEPDNAIEGETYSYVIIRAEFISEMRTLCEQSLATQSFETQELRNKEIADCTFDKLSFINIDAINSFNNQVCENPATQEEIDICNALN